MLPFSYVKNTEKIFCVCLVVGAILAFVLYPYLGIKSKADWALYFRYYAIFFVGAIALPMVLLGKVIHSKKVPPVETEEEWRSSEGRYRLRVYLLHSTGFLVAIALGWVVGGFLYALFV